MQGYPHNVQPNAPLLEFRRPVAGPYRAEVGEKLARCRQSFQDGLDFRAESEKGRLDARSPGFQFLARKADGAGVPIDFLGPQAGPVGLRRARVPEQFIKVSPFRVLFAQDDGRVFCGAFALTWTLCQAPPGDGFSAAGLTGLSTSVEGNI